MLPTMGEFSARDTARLLMLLAEFGSAMSQAFKQVAEPELIDNAALLVLGRVELEGPKRPHDLAAEIGMTTGGMSKLLDRMEGLGVVRRRRGEVPDDGRAVVVAITDTGSDVLDRIAEELGAALPQTRALVREMVELLGDRVEPGEVTS